MLNFKSKMEGDIFQIDIFFFRKFHRIRRNYLYIFLFENIFENIEFQINRGKIDKQGDSNVL